MTWSARAWPLALSLILAASSRSATITVTDSGDSGTGTLRQAILDANADSSPEVMTIGFNIPGPGVQTIAPLTGLPTITRPVTIDGYTQPGSSPNTLAAADDAILRIELTGASLGVPDYGLRFRASDCAVRGLVINAFTNGTAGILLEDSTNMVIEGSFIGTDPSGNNALPNDDGILIRGASINIRVGGTEPATRNVIAANSNGCWISHGQSNVVQGNFIGTDVTGTAALGQNNTGVYVVGGWGDVIGGTAPGAGNVIASSAFAGVAVLEATNTAILGNSMFALGGAGIILGSGGSIPNDPNDADDGANHLQNFPELEAAQLASGDLTLHYRVDSASANSAYPLTVEFFKADAGGAGKSLIYRDTYSTAEAFTVITFTPTVAVNDGDAIVATATDANGNTSEFSSATIAEINHPPMPTHSVADQNSAYGSAFNLTLAENTFTDPDSGQLLSYTAEGLPPGLAFNGATRTFVGTLTGAGNFSITVTATDNGAPPLSTNVVFNIAVAKASLVVTVNNHSKPPGQPNPLLDGTLTGIVNGDNITVTFVTTADTASPAGSYPITPVLADPDQHLPNYGVTTNAGTLTIVCPAIVVSPTTLLDPTSNSPYSQTLSAASGAAPYTFTLTSGTLPSGLSLSDAGLLSGTPTSVGSYSFVVTATDASGCQGNRTYSLNVPVPVYEGFDYAPGPLAGGNGGVGFSNAWSGANTVVVLGGGSIGLGGPASGNLIGLQGNGTITRRLLQPIGAPGTVRYLSFAGQVIYPPFGPPPNLQGERVGIVLNSTGGGGLFVGKPPTGSFANWVLEDAGGGAQVAGPPILSFVPSMQALLVVKCEFFAGNDRFTLYVNPVRGQPEPATGTVKTGSDVGTLTNIAFVVAGLQGNWNLDEIRLAPTFAEAVPIRGNQPPTLANPIPDQNGTYGSPLNFTFGADVFTDPDPGQLLSYTASGLPLGIDFDTSTRTFRGTNMNAGTYEVSVTATDNGSPALGTTATFKINVGKVLLTAHALNHTNSYGDTIFLNAVNDVDYSGFVLNDNVFSLQSFPKIQTPTTATSPVGTYPIQLSGGADTRYDFVLQDAVLNLVPAPLTVVVYNGCRLPKTANPPLSGRLLGLLNNDPITVSFSTTTTSASPPGSYPISPALNDPNHRLANYAVSYLQGELTVLPYGFAFTIVHSFGTTNALGSDDIGSHPAGLLEGPGGVLYGLTLRGGVRFDNGTIFRMLKDGSGYLTLTPSPDPVDFPMAAPAPPTLGTNGVLYAVAPGNGSFAPGSIFSVGTNGGNLAILHTFSAEEGPTAAGPVLFATDGFLYGVAANGNNVIYRIAPDGTGFIILWQNSVFGTLPAQFSAGLIEGSDGLLYGTSVSGGDYTSGTVFSITKGGSLTVLHSFKSGPWSRLIEASDGWLYGTTLFGGRFDEGTVFKMAKDGSGFSVLHQFDHMAGDGNVPIGSLVEANDGYLYGTTREGGSSTQFGGVIYRLRKDGTGYCVVHHFGPSNKDPWYPTSGLIQSVDGSFYGTTQGGGEKQLGSVFRLTPLVPPTLAITPAAANTVGISWSPPTPGFILQQNNSLSASGWTDAPTGPTNSLSLPLAPDGRFYRLIKR